jgi:hypothetical protein
MKYGRSRYRKGRKMVAIPKQVMEVINHPDGAKVVATRTPKGEVHAIIVGSLSAPNPSTIVFGTLIMHKTSENLRDMCRKGELASVLVVKGMASFEVRAKIIGQRTEDRELDRMNEQLAPLGLRMTSVWYLEPMEVYDQSASYNAGTRMA